MNSLIDLDRRVIPRWRLFQRTLATKELSSSQLSKGRKQNFRIHSDVNTIPLDKWDVTELVQLIEELIVEDRLDVAREAINYIVTSSSISELTKGTFRSLFETNTNHDREIRNGLDLIEEISKLKYQVRKWPRNGLAWSNLALMYCSLGFKDRSKHCMNIALYIAPNNRYILRAACRLLIHLDDPIKASELLARVPHVKTDPWLLSAQIASTHIAGKNPRLYKRAKELLDSQSLNDFSISELAATMGTYEYEYGSYKIAKGYFKLASKAPNDNVLAQLEWFRTDKESSFHSILPQKNIKFDFEANVYKSRQDGNWNNAVEFCKEWNRDESFSNRPITMGTFIAIEACNDGQLAERIAKSGLTANRDDFYLLNNLSVALAMQGKVESATVKLNEAKSSNPSIKESRLLTLATEGMIQFRSGNIVDGRTKYLESVKTAINDSRFEDAKRAILYLTSEELLIQSKIGLHLGQVVPKKIQKFSMMESQAMLQRIRKSSSGRTISLSVDTIDDEFSSEIFQILDYLKNR